jgi:hypothetical protein
MNAIILKGAALLQPPLPHSGPRAKTIAHPWSRRPTQLTVPKNVDVTHSTFLDDRRYQLKDSRDPVDIPRNNSLYYSRERALSLTGSQMSPCYSEASDDILDRYLRDPMGFF